MWIIDFNGLSSLVRINSSYQLLSVDGVAYQGSDRLSSDLAPIQLGDQIDSLDAGNLDRLVPRGTALIFERSVPGGLGGIDTSCPPPVTYLDLFEGGVVTVECGPCNVADHAGTRAMTCAGVPLAAAAAPYPGDSATWIMYWTAFDPYLGTVTFYNDLFSTSPLLVCDLLHGGPQSLLLAGDSITFTYEGQTQSCLPTHIRIDPVQTLNGQLVNVGVSRAAGALLFGGFDLLIAYDGSALTFIGADTGDLLDSLGWEYFTYRTGAEGNCSGGCPSGLVRLVAIADLDNGSSQHPLESADIGELANLRFQVTSDRNFIGQCVPVRFYWNDCGDNVFSSVSGDTTYLDKVIIDASGNLIWNEDDDVQFPESARPQGLGALDDCLLGGGLGKPEPEREIWFEQGWVCINEPPDDRGDLNLNGVANEVGDAVLYTNYFIYGSSVWSPPYQDVQLLASDVNDDGVVLTVADLIYLIRVITGDEQPFPPGGNPKTAPYSNSGSAMVRTESDQLIVSTTSPVDLGGAWLVFRYSGMAAGEPMLLDAATGMNLRYNTEAGELRVLVHPSWEGNVASIGAGSHEILSIPITGDGTIELVDVQMSDAHGALLSTAVAKSFVPKSYALLQNYPNPFNAGTVIAFDLIEDADWDLTIYNVLGQAVRRFEGNNGAGRVSVTWDGRTDVGNSASSGIYLYRISANGFMATKKMTLVK